MLTPLFQKIDKKPAMGKPVVGFSFHYKMRPRARTGQRARARVIEEKETAYVFYGKK